MTDEIDKLARALKARTPAPDPAARSRAVSVALEHFDAHQETAARPRHTPDRPDGAGFWSGVRTMLAKHYGRAALAAGGSVAVLGLAVLMVGDDMGSPDLRQPSWATGPRPSEPLLEEAAGRDREDRGASVSEITPRGLVETRDIGPPPAPQSMLDAADQPLVAPDLNALDDARSSLGVDQLSQAARLQPEALAEVPVATAATETYAGADPNPVKSVIEAPVSTFSIDVDTASYAVVRRFLAMGSLPPEEAVRIEEMVNYFPYDYAPPEPGEAPFRPTVTVTPTPWNADTALVHIAIQGRMPAIEDRLPLNLVFLIDTSGSMQDADKLPLLKQSFRLLLNRLRPEDRVAIVTYAGAAGLALEPTSVEERETILAALDQMEAGGSTAGEAGLQQAYAVAEGMARDGDVTRVILATDGDFNVGLSDPEALKDYIANKRDGGTYLSVLGFGRGNLDDATMQALAQNGNGTAAYIDTASEARKVLSDQVAGALFPIADDVKVQVEFNPATIAEYRLIGYETRALAREDFNDDRVDAGEIGAGHSVTALYEVTPVGSPARRIDPLRYEEPTPVAGQADEFGWLKLRYKEPGAATSQLIELPILAERTPASADVRFAIAMAGFGQLLSGARYLGDWGWDEAIALAEDARGVDPFNYRGEAVQLMRLARELAR